MESAVIGVSFYIILGTCIAKFYLEILALGELDGDGIFLASFGL